MNAMGQRQGKGDSHRPHLHAVALSLAKVLWSTAGSEGEGVRLLSELAAAGDAEALHVLGLAFFRGQGVDKDLVTARKLQLAAAARGFPPAQHELSLLLAQGHGGEADAKGARRWEAKARAGGKRVDSRFSTLLAVHHDKEMP